MFRSSDSLTLLLVAFIHGLLGHGYLPLEISIIIEKMREIFLEKREVKFNQFFEKPKEVVIFDPERLLLF